MELTHGDRLFNNHADRDHLPERFSYFGNNFGTTQGFFEYIEGYLTASEILYQNYVTYPAYRNDIFDTLIYPMCFIYRHITELYIKYHYFKYANTNHEDKVSFIRSVSHKLVPAWNKTKVHIEPLIRKIGASIDITLFDDLIGQIDEFDSDSFRMRYPIKKDLSSVHDEVMRLDVYILHERMNSMFALFQDMDKTIDGVIIDNICTPEFEERFLRVFHESIEPIMNIYNLLKRIVKEQEYECFDKISAEKELYVNINNLPSTHAAVLALLLHTGDIIDPSKLAIDDNERKKDIIKLIEATYNNNQHFISFEGTFSNEDMCYSIFEKSLKVPLSWLKRILPEIEMLSR